MKDRTKEIITIVIFAVLIGSAYIVWPIFRPFLAGENTENRNLAEMPVFSWETLSAYPSQLESYINDHLPFRSRMVELNSMVSYYLMDTPTSTSVAKGSDDWLFYKAEGSMDDYTGRKIYTEEQLQTMARNLEMTKENCEAQGTEFILFIAPNRERVYSEDMPSYYGSPSETNILNQVVSYLKENTDITVVCPYEELMAAKASDPDRILYHKTDTHWNDLGAYIGVQELFKAAGAEWDGSNVTVTEAHDLPGDMANMMNLADVIETGKEYKLSGFQHEDTVKTQEEAFFGHWAYSSPSALNGSILVNRDSFCSAMAQYIKEAYRTSDMVHRQGFSNELVEEEKPDVYVFEVVERGMDILTSYSYNNLSFETDFGTYLDKLSADKDRYIIFLSAMDEASSSLTPELVQKLQQLGVKIDLTGKYRYSFYSVIDGGENIAEDCGLSMLSRSSATVDGVSYTVTSAGFDCGDTSSVVINGGEYTKRSRGLNIVVYDKKYGAVVDSVAFDTCDGLAAVR